MKIQKIFAVIILLFASPLYAGTYYVDDNGDATWATCEHNAAPVGPKSGSKACSLLTANSSVTPGDTVYLREGTYYPTSRTDNIHPGASGTSSQRITYESYTGETAILDGSRSTFEALLFGPGWNSGNSADGRSYITVRNITFQYWNKFADFYYASYNEIDSCTFYHHKGADEATGAGYIGIEISWQSKHNYIHDCTGYYFGHFVGKDQGSIVNIGFDIGGNADNSYNDNNTLENNHFYASGHHLVGVNNGSYNVVRNNYLHNDGWYPGGACADMDTGVCGYRVMSMTDNSGLGSGNNLIEDNFIAYGAQYGGPHLVSGASGSGLTIATIENIVRYNKFFGNVEFGARIGSSISGSPARDSHIFNNTFYYNGWNMDSWGVVNEDDDRVYDSFRGAFSLYLTSGCGRGEFEGIVVKNNLAHETWSEKHTNSGSSYYPAFFESGIGACNTITNNYGNEGSIQGSPFTPWADPQFVDPDISDPKALTLSNGEWTGKPNLRLQSGSPAIDGGTYLAQANGSGSGSTALIVDDARYFQDGTWGSDIARSTFHADWIAIGTVTNVVQINSINYNTKTITLASAMTWSDDDRVWLYKKSDGTIVLNGNEPDYGAYEYVYLPAGTPPAAPTGFRRIPDL